MAGYIKLHRGWRDNALFGGEFSRADAWVWLIENAAWKPTRSRIKGSTVDIGRGELTFSVRFLAEKWGWSKSRVDRFLADLREEGMIETRSKIGTTAGHPAGQGQSIITLCNYDKYQSNDEDARDNGEAPSGTSAGQQRDKEEERKEGKKKITPAKPDDVSERVWLDFLDHRRVKRAPVSETVLVSMRRECGKVGWTLEAAMAACVTRGWQGFDSKFVRDDQRSAPASSGDYLDHVLAQHSQS